MLLKSRKSGIGMVPGGICRCRFLLCPALLLLVCVVVLQVMDGILFRNCTIFSLIRQHITIFER